MVLIKEGVGSASANTRPRPPLVNKCISHPNDCASEGFKGSVLPC